MEFFMQRFDPPEPVSYAETKAGGEAVLTGEVAPIANLEDNR